MKKLLQRELPGRVLGLQQVAAEWDAAGNCCEQVLPQAGQQGCCTCSRKAPLSGVLLW